MMIRLTLLFLLSFSHFLIAADMTENDVRTQIEHALSSIEEDLIDANDPRMVEQFEHLKFNLLTMDDESLKQTHQQSMANPEYLAAMEMLETVSAQSDSLKKRQILRYCSNALGLCSFSMLASVCYMKDFPAKLTADLIVFAFGLYAFMHTEGPHRFVALSLLCSTVAIFNLDILLQCSQNN